jgi:MFS family permease
MMLNSTPEDREGYRYYVLGLLVVVYALNFIDRQIISVLALDLKHDLHLSDADLGFLYGTAFGVFYAVFGIPLGRLADSWQRVLTTARIGVGIGEAAASPCAYSLLCDYFPRENRATVLGIYSSGMYLGTGLSLFLGASIVGWWNSRFPGGWNGIAGWQAAFLGVGIPGLILALIVSRVREPVRGRFESVLTPPVAHPFRGFAAELLTVVPPLTLVGAARRGTRALVINIVAAALIGIVSFVLARSTGNALQWAAFGTGVYAVFSWVIALSTRDRPTFALTWQCPSFLLLLGGYGLTAMVNYAVVFWSLPYVESTLGASKTVAGLIIGGGGAAGGFLGLMLGGRLSDRLKRSNPAGRVLVMLFAALAPVILFVIAFTTTNLTVFYVLYFPMTILSSSSLGAVGATAQDLVLPRMRGAATAMVFLSITMVGLALGPYSVGRISVWTGNLGTAMLSLLVLIPFAVAAFLILYRQLPAAEASVLVRARLAGEPA